MRTLDRYGDYGQSELASFVADNQLQAELSTGPVDHTILFGIDGQYADYSDVGISYTVDPIDIYNPVYGGPIVFEGYYQDADYKLGQLGVYLQEQLEIGRLTLVAGGRHDWASIETVDRVAGVDDTQDDRAFSERLGAVYQFDYGIAPYASYSTSFLPIVGTDAAGNPFDPEKGEQYEAGIKFQPPGWNSFVTVSAFDLTQENVLTHRPRGRSIPEADRRGPLARHRGGGRGELWLRPRSDRRLRLHRCGDHQEQ